MNTFDLSSSLLVPLLAVAAISIGVEFSRMTSKLIDLGLAELPRTDTILEEDIKFAIGATLVKLVSTIACRLIMFRTLGSGRRK